MLKDCCAIAAADIMNNTIPQTRFVFMLAPLTMTEFTMFSTSGRGLTRLLMTGSQLSALRTPLLLGLPVGRAAVVAAQRIRARLAGSLRDMALLGGLRDPFLLSLCYGMAILTLLRGGSLCRLRSGVVATVVVALGYLLQLFA